MLLTKVLRAGPKSEGQSVPLPVDQKPGAQQRNFITSFEC
mgnify:CR=1 FL=1